MKELNFATGLEEYKLADGCVVRFNPTDTFFVERLYNTFCEIDKKDGAFHARVDKLADKEEVFQLGHESDAEIREMINAIFGEDICTPVIGGMCIWAWADGMPVWANILLAIMDEIDTTFAREQKATNPRIKKYTEKYKKYMK